MEFVTKKREKLVFSSSFNPSSHPSALNPTDSEEAGLHSLPHARVLERAGRRRERGLQAGP